MTSFKPGKLIKKPILLSKNSEECCTHDVILKITQFLSKLSSVLHFFIFKINVEIVCNVAIRKPGPVFRDLKNFEI